MRVDVLIPAYNAAGSIGRAVASALAEPEVASVIVVDDCSSDETAPAATAAGAGDARLQIVRFAQNRGPAAARNHALSLGSAPLVTMLDADDWLLPGRFRRLLDGPDEWDFIADNILFRQAVDEFSPLPIALLGGLPARRRRLGLAEFVDRNISRPGKRRSELGFLKPVMRRSVLEQSGLSYAGDVRLGEDFVLYCRAMALGARFMLSLPCGYIAIEHAGSLSGRHSVADLEAFLAATRTIADSGRIFPEERRMLARHHASIERKIRHRKFLETKRERGIGPACLAQAGNPLGLVQVAVDVYRDKRGSASTGQPAKDRMLLDPDDFADCN